MNNIGRQKLSSKLLVRLMSIPLIPLVILSVLLNLVSVNARWLLPAVGFLLLVTVFCLVVFVLRPVRILMSVMAEMMLNNRDLLEQSQEQAQTLEEIFAALGQVNGSIHQTSRNAGVADQLSRSTLEEVYNGERFAADMLEAMGQISVSSKRVKEISRVVHDIASQTNILAINAAVEAARGGENAKGFAIVAAEIKNLAKRATDSAREIEQQIMDNLERVEQGNVVVRQTSEVLKRIVTNTGQTSEVVAEVARAMTEQAAALQQIEAAVNQLNQIIQENATLSDSRSRAEQRMNELGMLQQVSLGEV